MRKTWLPCGTAGAISPVVARHLRWTVVFAGTLAASSLSTVARGAEAPSPAASRADETHRPTDGSGYQLSLGEAYLLPTATAVLLWSARSWTTTEGALAAAAPMVLAAPAVHLSKGRGGAAASSLFGQLGGGTLGALLGWGVGSFACRGDGMDCAATATRALMVGALAGQVSFGMIDVFGMDELVTGEEEVVTPFVSPMVGESRYAGRSPWGIDVVGFEFGVEARL